MEDNRMRQTPHSPNLVAEAESVRYYEERVPVACVEVGTCVQVWERAGKGTEGAVEGEHAV